MPTPTIEKLLVLQERDSRRLSLENQLRGVPRDVAAVEEKIAGERTSIEAARTEGQQLEARKKALEGEIGAAQEQVARYRSQQLQVRKNDEYQALGHQIDGSLGQVGTLEEEELKVMYAIDEAKRRFAQASADHQQNIAGHEARIKVLSEREANLQAELATVRAAVDAARAQVDESVLRVYDRISAKPGMPAVVAVHEGRCGGCHLKISSNVDSETRKADKITICDQCGRIVYWEA